MAKTPIWKSIRQTLQDEIQSGLYRPGDKLPTEHELTSRFGVNRHTIRHALSALAEEDIVRSRRGSGVYVSNTPTTYPIGKRVRFHQNIELSGRLPKKKPLRVETRPASKAEAKALNLSADALVHVYEGVSLAEVSPIALFTSVFPAERFPDIPMLLENETSVTAILKMSGVQDYTRVSTKVNADKANPTQAIHLAVREGDPLIRTTGVNADPDGNPIEYGTTFFAGDRVTLTIQTSDTQVS